MTVEGAEGAGMGRGSWQVTSQEVLDPALCLPLLTDRKCSAASGHGHERSGLLSSEPPDVQGSLLALARDPLAHNPKLTAWDG